MKRRIIVENRVYIIDERKPSLFSLIPCALRDKSFHESIRWLLQLPFGYYVYTMRDKNSAEEIAYCFISFAGNYRYPFASNTDIIVGPYYVAPSKRGNHYASELIATCLDLYQGKTAWDFIQHTNIASVRTTESLGFEYFADVSYSRVFRVLKLCEPGKTGEMKLYRRTNKTL